MDSLRRLRLGMGAALLASVGVLAQNRQPATALEFAQTAAEFAHSLGAHAGFGGPIQFADYTLQGTPQRRVNCAPKSGWWSAALGAAPGPFWRPAPATGEASLGVTVYYDPPTPECLFGIFDEELRVVIKDGKIDTTRNGYWGSAFQGEIAGNVVTGTLSVPAAVEATSGRDLFRLPLTLTRSTAERTESGFGIRNWGFDQSRHQTDCRIPTPESRPAYFLCAAM